MSFSKSKKWIAIILILATITFVLLNPRYPMMSEGFPEEIEQWLRNGSGEITVREVDEEIEWVCPMGAYLTLNENMARFGLPEQSKSYNPEISENQFGIILDYGNQRVEYLIFAPSDYQLRYRTFSGCAHIGETTKLTIHVGPAGGYRWLEVANAGRGKQ